MRLRALALVCSVLSMASGAASQRSMAQDYPVKPIRIVVPFTAGASTDIVARTLAQRLTEVWKQPAVVDNRLGAAGTIGSGYVAKSPPDGYTLLMATTSTHGISPHLIRNISYDPVKDFAPVSLIVWAPNVLVVHPSLPVKSVKELIAFAKARPGQLLFSSSGSGGSIHLAGELFKSMAKLDMVHVPYKGATPALVDLAAGRVHLMFNTVASALPFVKDGRLRPLGLTTPQRSSVLPQVPTIAEAALPGYEMVGYIGLLAPAQTPKDIVAKLHAEVVKLLATPQAKERFSSLGVDPAGSTPQAFADVLTRELPKYAKIIRDAGMTPE